MHWTDNSINRIVTSMNELRQKCSAKCTELTQSAKIQNIELSRQITQSNVTGTFAAVDSGFSTKQFLSLDVVLVRSVAAIFTYNDAKLVASTYFPNRVPGISLHCGSFSDQTESTYFKSLSRLTAEITCAIQTVKIHSPQMLMLDGSILPLPSDQPQSTSTLFPMYQELVDNYRELFELCGSQNCQLVGIVKDSRSQRLCNLLEQRLKMPIPNGTDEFLCDLLLTAGQRSITFAHSDQPNGFSKNINCFYIKTGNGLPFRVEFIANNSASVGGLEQEADAIAGQLMPISNTFSYPAILIETDMRACLTPNEINHVFNSIENRSKEFVLRSNSRPFR